MIVESDFLNRLRDFGLNSYEAKLWAALLSRGVSTVGELSDIANVPRSRSYDVLESLEKKGFIVIKIDKPIKYIAVPPEEVLERVKKKIKRDAEKETKVLDDFKSSELLEELNILHKTGIDMVEPTDLSGAFKGRKRLYAHLESLIKNAEKSIVLVTTKEGILRKHKEFKKVLKKASKNGVKIRIAADFNKKHEHIIKELSEYAQVKKSNLDSRFLLVDGEDISFMVMDDEEVHPSYDVGVWVKTKYFASTFEKMFNSQWKNMKSA